MPRSADQSAPRAQQGFLDLSRTVLTTQPAALSGEWCFVWQLLIPPAPARMLQRCSPESGIAVQSVPGVWRRSSKEPGPQLHQGFASYYLHVRLPKDTPIVSIKMLPVDTAYRLYANGQLVAASGKVGANPENAAAEWRPRTADIVTRSPDIDLVLHVSNFDLEKGGPFYPIYIGSPAAIRLARDEGVLRDALLAGVLGLFGLYHIWLWLFRRSEQAALFLGLASLFAALHGLTHGEKLFFELLAGWPWELLQKVNVLSGYAILPLGLGFFGRVFPHYFNKYIIYAWQTLCAVFIGIVLLWPARVHFQTGVPYYFVNLAAYAYATIALGVACIKRPTQAGLFFAGVIMILAALIHDLLFEMGLVHDFPWYSLGILLFIFFQSIALAGLFAKSFQKVERLSAELEERNTRLLRLDELKDEFLANTSHELRTPLNGIIGITESLLQGISGQLNEIATSNLRLVAASGRRLSSLVNDILDFSKLQHSDIILRLRSLELESAVDLVLGLSQPLVDQKPISLIHERSSAIFVQADEDRLQQILHNLIGNAIKFTKSGQVVVRYHIQAGDAGESGAQNMVWIEIQDSGIGIPAAKHELIFQSFTQADGSVAREYGGTGLGLSITKRIVELHGGQMQFESVVGQGSTFRFSLPVGESSSESSSADFRAQKESLAEQKERAATHLPATQLGRSLPDARDRESVLQPLTHTDAGSDEVLNEAAAQFKPAAHILVVDDDPVNRQVLKNHLSLQHYQITEAANGKEALAWFDQGQQFDLILLDVMMPGLSGYEVCQILRMNHSASELPVILLTAKNRMHDLVAGLEHGANDYLAKPFDPMELQARVHTMLRFKDAARSQSDLAAVRNELQLARQIQESLLPDQTPQYTELELTTRYRAMESVGGDFFDFLVNPDSLGIILADVSGHGVPAALIVSMVKIAFNQQHEHPDQPADLFQNMNSILWGNTGDDVEG
ncbi:MAG: response regulator [Leptospiraceae bacterium]|nr:response regulator [Leptospiraceae bacterium]